MSQFADYALEVRSRPARPDWRANPSRPRSTRRSEPPPIIGEFCAPADCPHPVVARVWPTVSGFRATCHDCGLSLTWRETWEVAVP